METKFNWKPKKNQLLILLLVGVLLIVIAMPTKKQEERDENAVSENVKITSDKEYEEVMEKKLEKTLREVEGVGSVKVMITFQSTSEKIVEKDEEENKQTIEESDHQGGSRNSKDTSRGETTVYDSTSAGGQVPYVSKEINPKVEGVIVVAQGGDNPVVIKNITEAIQALFDVEMHKIKVMKRNQTN